MSRFGIAALLSTLVALGFVVGLSHGDHVKKSDAPIESRQIDIPIVSKQFEFAAIVQTDEPMVYTPPNTSELPAGPATARVLPYSHPFHRKWPREIRSGVISPDGKTIALYDGGGVYLSNMQGRNMRRIRISLHEKMELANESTAVSFAFRSDSRRVAILTRLLYGEPLGATIERLWTADVASGRFRKLSEWAGRVQGAGPQAGDRTLGGWTRDGRSVIVVGIVYDGMDMPSDAREIGSSRVSFWDGDSRKQLHKRRIR